jgi:hypothetical protein
MKIWFVIFLVMILLAIAVFYTTVIFNIEKTNWCSENNFNSIYIDKRAFCVNEQGFVFVPNIKG